MPVQRCVIFQFGSVTAIFQRQRSSILRLAIQICNTHLSVIQIPSSSFSSIKATGLHDRFTSGCQAKSIFQRCFLQNLKVCTVTCINSCRAKKRSLACSSQNCDRKAPRWLQIFERCLELKISPTKPILCILHSLCALKSRPKRSNGGLCIGVAFRQHVFRFTDVRRQLICCGILADPNIAAMVQIRESNSRLCLKLPVCVFKIIFI